MRGGVVRGNTCQVIVAKEQTLRKHDLVPKAGLEPARPRRRGILNPLRLPFRHLGLAV